MRESEMRIEVIFHSYVQLQECISNMGLSKMKILQNWQDTPKLDGSQPFSLLNWYTGIPLFRHTQPARDRRPLHHCHRARGP